MTLAQALAEAQRRKAARPASVAAPAPAPASTGQPAPSAWAFVVEGAPVGKGRPRVTARGTFTPERTRAYEAHAASAVRAAGVAAGDGPVAVAMTVWTETRRRMDLDNIVKAVLDALVTGGGVSDDACTVVRVVRAEWAGVDKARPRVEVVVTRLL